ncbi:MAG: histone acetyltransferase HPA2, partial [Pseudomonas aeruginosa]|nr:histone acetyltransferase HPA2 [Pseudomonas aeruginosa]
SNCLIRRLNPDYPKEDDAFLLADDQGLLLRPKPAQPAGYACYRAAGRVRQLQARFEQAWDTSLSDPDLRSFLL